MSLSAIADAPRRGATAACGTLAAEPDPIFAAIEAHTSAYIKYARLGDVVSHLKSTLPDRSSNPAYVAAELAHKPAIEAEWKAAAVIASTVPTTMAGVTALLNYIHNFNNGLLNEAVGVPKGWASNDKAWPDDFVPLEKGDAKYPSIHAVQFGFWILDNVREALIELGAK